jgi:hypothetical protein
MKRVTTALFLSLSLSTFSPSALAQAGGEGGSSADGAAGESSAGGNGAGSGGEAGAEGAPDAGPGDAGTDAGPRNLDLLENDGGRACSLGRASGGEGLLVAFALTALSVAFRRRTKR